MISFQYLIMTEFSRIFSTRKINLEADQTATSGQSRALVMATRRHPSDHLAQTPRQIALPVAASSRMDCAILMKSSRTRPQYAIKAAKGSTNIKERKYFRETTHPSGGRERRLGTELQSASRVGFQQQSEMDGRQRIPLINHSSVTRASCERS